MDFPRCSNADIDWYVRMLADPPKVNHKVEMLPQPCEEEDATLESALPMIVSILTRVGKHTGTILIPCMLARFKLCQASLKRRAKQILYHLAYINKF